MNLATSFLSNLVVVSSKVTTHRRRNRNSDTEEISEQACEQAKVHGVNLAIPDQKLEIN